MGAIQGRARRGRLPVGWINPNDPQHHAARRRSGRRRHAEQRRDLEFLVQPADGADLPRDRRQRVSVSRVQRTTGERIGVRREPRQLRRDLAPRLAAGRRRRVRLRGPRSAQSRYRLRRPKRDAVRSADRPGVDRGTGRGARRRAPELRRDIPAGADAAGRLLRGGQARAVLRQQLSLEDDRRRQHVAADQPRPDARDARDRRRASASTALRRSAKTTAAARGSSTPSDRRIWT